MTDVVLFVHRPGPVPDEPPFTRRCEACGNYWPCPYRKAQLQAEAADMVETRHGEARRIGVLALVEPGVSCWSSTRKDAREEPLGGVVVEIQDVPNPETGEFERYFTCLDPYGGGKVRVHRLSESEVLPTGIEATTNSRIVNLIKRLACEVAEMKGSYLDIFHADRIRWLGTLAGVTNLAA